jgi:hypothetical protein
MNRSPNIISNQPLNIQEPQTLVQQGQTLQSASVQKDQPMEGEGQASFQQPLPANVITQVNNTTPTDQNTPQTPNEQPAFVLPQPDSPLSDLLVEEQRKGQQIEKFETVEEMSKPLVSSDNQTQTSQTPPVGATPQSQVTPAEALGSNQPANLGHDVVRSDMTGSFNQQPQNNNEVEIYRFPDQGETKQ